MTTTSPASWYLAAVVAEGDKLKILDIKPCASTNYVEAWQEAGQVRRAKDAPCVIVIDGPAARLWENGV